MTDFFELLEELNFRETLESHLYNNCSLSISQEDKGSEIYANISFPDNSLDMGESTNQQMMVAKIFVESLKGTDIEINDGLRGMFLRDLKQRYIYQISSYDYVNDYVKCDLVFIGRYYD